MGEQEQLAGLGKLYVTTADDKNLEHLQEGKVHKIDFKDIPDDVEHHRNGKGKGFTITATARIDCPEGNKKLLKLLTMIRCIAQVVMELLKSVEQQMNYNKEN